MDELDNEFFDAYKHLDKICGEKFGCRNGVSEYIAQMERKSWGEYRVPSWSADYRALKRIRWVRNQIAHDTVGCAVCEENDLYFAEEFYNRIMSIDDPLARLRKEEQRIAQAQRQNSRAQRAESPAPDASHKKLTESPERRTVHAFWRFAGLLLLLFCIFCICRWMR